MLRAPLARTLALGARGPTLAVIRTTATTPAKVPEKIEVFVDDQSVMVEPGTTVLQVREEMQFFNAQLCISQLIFLCLFLVFRLQRRLVLKFPASVIMSDWQWPEIVVCVWWRLKSRQNR